MCIQSLDSAHLSLPATPLSQILGINGTLVANQFVRADPSQTDAPSRTVITLDNGGSWHVVSPPSSRLDGSTSNCEPPSCSLQFHMDNSDYGRLGVYSEVCTCVCSTQYADLKIPQHIF